MEIMDRKQVAEHFHVRPRTVGEWVKQGKLPAPTRMGRFDFWFVDSIKKVEEAMRVRSEKNLRHGELKGYV